MMLIHDQKLKFQDFECSSETSSDAETEALTFEVAS